MNSKFKTLLITVSIAFLLSACGSGSGSGTNGDDYLMPERPPEAPEPVASMSQIISLLLVD
jgi:hypothetical protein